MKTAPLLPRADLSSRPTSNCSELAPKCEECGAEVPSLLCRAKGDAWARYFCNTCRLLAEAVVEARTRDAATIERYTAATAVAALRACITEDHDPAWVSRVKAERRLDGINKLLRKVLADVETLERFRV